jgi:hypothetical protein
MSQEAHHGPSMFGTFLLWWLVLFLPSTSIMGADEQNGGATGRGLRIGKSRLPLGVASRQLWVRVSGGYMYAALAPAAQRTSRRHATAGRQREERAGVRPLL